MDPIIFRLPIVKSEVKISSKNVEWGDKPSPKLIKYGFIDLANKLDMVSLTSIPYYRIGLEVDPERDDKKSITSIAKDKLEAKGSISSFFLTCWEILHLFNLIHPKIDVLASNVKVLEQVADAHEKLTKAKNKMNVSDKLKGKYDLVVQHLSPVDIDENSAVKILLKELPGILSAQKKGSTMVLQLFDTQTQIMAEIIFFLISHYDESYLIKPSVSSILSSEKYIVLIGLKDQVEPDLPKIPSNSYCHRLIKEEVPSGLTTIIQCFNSEIVPLKIETYYKIKTYLDGKVYEGATYQEMKELQDKNSEEWCNEFSKISQIPKILESSLKKTDANCNHFMEWSNMFN